MTDPDQVLADLKDFQRDTARYVFRRMYLDPEPARRFLVADEVGLGKTLVARGVIAQTIAHLRERGDPRIDIVYVCSNTAIVRQNLRSLTRGLAGATIAGRLCELPAQRNALRPAGVNIIALTPGTSLQHGTALGTTRERALALEFLRSVLGPDVVDEVGVYRAFAGNIAGADGSLSVLRARFDRELGVLKPVWRAKGIFTGEFRIVNNRYRDANGRWIGEDLTWLGAEYRKQPSNRDPDTGRIRNDLVGHVRRAMAATGAALLHPDLIIFDEFQRFADLLHVQDADLQPLVARLLDGSYGSRNVEATRTLLLSATPYRMHTTDIERSAGEEDHYHDLLRTVRFLLGDTGAELTSGHLRRLRDALLRIPHDGLEPARDATAALSQLLRSVMVRTERLGSTPDRDGMLRTVTHEVAGPRPDDIRAYLAATRTADQLRTATGDALYDLVELWKSTPYLLSFLTESYQVKAALTAAVRHGRTPDLTTTISGTPAALPWDDIDAYREVDPGNARMRHLVDDAADEQVHELLWLPPSAPYYHAGGPFETHQARSFTKRLVFSAWHATPNAISAMMSYRTEQATIGSKRGGTYTDAMDKAPRPLRADADTTYLLLYPSMALAEIIDPLTIAADGGTPPPSWPTVYDAARQRLTDSPHISKITSNPSAGPRDPRWYVVAMLLLDTEHRTGDHLAPALWARIGTDEESTAYAARMRWLADIAATGKVPDDLGAVPEDLVDVLAEVALASPAVCALRGIRRVLPGAEPGAQSTAAARIAEGFRGLFNGPEATAIVTRSTSDTAYWRECLQYAAQGNLQAVLDEYLHVATEWKRYSAENLDELATLLHSVLTLRAVPNQVDVVDGAELVTRRMRSRYAARFAKALDDAQGEIRAERVSDAFNSPFWPYVLATTSIGQEGLDFHLYCHAVVHWNLPHNPVDLEQREGRVHRYKGHAVRKNVAALCGLPDTTGGDPWQAMFAAAAATRPAGQSDIVPYWVFDGPAKVERHLLVQPYTRDASVLPHLLNSTALYRIAFGQPRQEELLRGLGSTLTDAQLAGLGQIRVNLTPPTRPTSP